MQKAKIGDRVKVHYTGTLEDGTVFDTSQGSGPIEFVIGNGDIIPGFEHAIIGMEVGEKKAFQLPPEECYGPHLDELVISIPISEVPPHISPEPGMELLLQAGEEAPIPVVITEVTEDAVVLDANHPLAGKTLSFEVELVEIMP